MHAVVVVSRYNLSIYGGSNVKFETRDHHKDRRASGVKSPIIQREECERGVL